MATASSAETKTITTPVVTKRTVIEPDREKREQIFKWVKFIAFGLLLFGGLNWLLVGLFEFDLVAGIFGGMESGGSRTIYSIIGIAAVTLLTVVLVKSFAKQSK